MQVPSKKLKNGSIRHFREVLEIVAQDWIDFIEWQAPNDEQALTSDQAEMASIDEIPVGQSFERPERIAVQVIEIIGQPGSALGQFNSPMGIEVSASGILFVADAKNHRLQIITPAGDVYTIGSQGEEAGQFNTPIDVSIGAQRIFVLERGNHRVQCFDQHGRLHCIFGGMGSGAGQFREPSGITVTTIQQVYVSDAGNARIQMFSSDGQFNRVVGDVTTLHTHLQQPHGLACDRDGFVT